MTLEDLLDMKVYAKNKDNEDIEITPEFRVAVQSFQGDGTHIIIHANGHDSDTLDFIVSGDTLIKV